MVPSQSCVELKIVSHSDVTIYLMLLNASLFWLCWFGLLKPLQFSNPRTFENWEQFFSIIYILFVFLQTARENLKASALDPCNVCESMKNDLPNNITANKLEKVQENLKVTREEKKKQTVYAEKDKQEIAKYAAICGVTVGFQKIPTKIPKLNRKCHVSMGKKSQKFHAGAEEGRNQCAMNN